MTFGWISKLKLNNLEIRSKLKLNNLEIRSKLKLNNLEIRSKLKLNNYATTLFLILLIIFFS